MISKLQSDAGTTSQWWRRVVNAYKVNAGMVCLQCKNCVIHTWALQRWASHKLYILFQISLSVLLATCHQCALILLETLALYKLFTYLQVYVVLPLPVVDQSMSLWIYLVQVVSASSVIRRINFVLYAVFYVMRCVSSVQHVCGTCFLVQSLHALLSSALLFKASYS